MGESFDKTYPFFGFLLGFVEFLVLFPKGIHIFGLLNENNFSPCINQDFHQVR